MSLQFRESKHAQRENKKTQETSQKMRTDYIDKRILELLLTALMPENRLALEICEATGIRISDCLSLKTSDIKRLKETGRKRLTIRELKTGKPKQIYLKTDYINKLLAYAGTIYCFPHRLDENKHRTRQAVFKDLKRVSRLYRLNGQPIKQNLAPHSMRKVYAVELRKKGKTPEQIRELLNHSSTEVTFLYCLADMLQEDLTIK